MSFAATNRVRVSSENSEHRGLLGTVKVAAADSGSGFNEVRLDGHANNRVVLLSDNELMSSTLPDPQA